MATLQDAFNAYTKSVIKNTSSNEMDGRSWLKFCKDLGLLVKPLGNNDCDIVFSQTITKSAQKKISVRITYIYYPYSSYGGYVPRKCGKRVLLLGDATTPHEEPHVRVHFFFILPHLATNIIHISCRETLFWSKALSTSRHA